MLIVLTLFKNDGAGNFAEVEGVGLGMIGDAIPSVHLGDIDSDGDIDLFVLGYKTPGEGAMGGSYNLVFLNDGSGRFMQDRDSALAIQGDASVAYGDINGDGMLDYVLSGEGSGSYTVLEKGVRVLLGKRVPSIVESTKTSRVLTTAIFADSDGAPRNRIKGVDVALGDLDNDGNLDLVLVRYVADTSVVPVTKWRATVMRNADGDGSFVHVDGSEMPNVMSVNAIADFNADGASDLLAVRSAGPSTVEVAVYLNNGDGIFDTGTAIGAYMSAVCGSNPTAVNGYSPDADGYLAATVPPGESNCMQTCLSAGDLDGDGDVDIIDCRGYVHLNVGDGVTFTASQIAAPGGTIAHTALSAQLGDIDGDGDLDYLVTADPGLSDQPGAIDRGKEFAVYRNDGAGAFTLVESHDSFIGDCDLRNCRRPFQLGDIDGDGFLDLIGNTFLYRNDGTGSFTKWAQTDPVHAGLNVLGKKEIPDLASVALVDYDDDGDLDVVMRSGSNVNTRSTEGDFVWKNGGFGVSFSQDTSQEFTRFGHVETGLMHAADIDGDGDMDFIITTQTGIQVLVTTFCPGGGKGPSGACFNCPGFAARRVNGDRCVECPANFVAAVPGSSVCVPCPPGTDRAMGTNECIECAPGLFTQGGGVACKTCAAGSFAESIATRECALCAPGSYRRAADDATVCLVCPLGAWCGEEAAEPSACLMGHYAALEGRTEETCSGACETGYICPLGSASETETSIYPACHVGYYRSAPGADEVVSCVLCTDDSEGIDCDVPGSEVETVTVKPGYWRMFSTSPGKHIVKCFNDFACIGAAVDDTTPTNQTTSTVSAESANATRRHLQDASELPMGTYGDALCAAGHVGPYCAVCKDKHFGGADNKKCVSCSGDIAMSFVGLGLFVIALIALLVMFIRGGKQSLGMAAALTKSATSGNVAGAVEGLAKAKAKKMVNDKINKEINNEISRSEMSVAEGASAKSAVGLKSYVVVLGVRMNKFYKKFQVKLKILISLVQIVNGMGAAFSIPYPPVMSSTTNAFSFLEIDLPAMMPLDCIVPMNYFGKLILRTVLPLVVYAIMLTAANYYRKRNKPWQADSLVDGVFFIVFLIYPSTAQKLFSAFICEKLEDGSGRMRADFSITCMDTDGNTTGEFVLITAFTIVMLIVHTVGTPATYAYLMFVKFAAPLNALRQQELADFHKARLDENRHLNEDEKAALIALTDLTSTEERVDPKKVLPGYLRKLTSGFEYRTFYFEIFETVRKVLLVGVPASFPGRGGNAQLVWGLLVCFLTFGVYSLEAPFISDSDDKLQQMAQTQVFLTLVSSIGLRMTPPDETLATIVAALLFALPIIAIFMESTLADELRGGARMGKQVGAKLMGMMSKKRVAPIGGESMQEPAVIDQVEELAAGAISPESPNDRAHRYTVETPSEAPAPATDEKPAPPPTTE